MPLTITIPGIEYVEADGVTLHEDKPDVLVLEHSLISISKWEAIWKKPYLDETYDKTNDELYSYIQCMTIKGNASENVLSRMTGEIYKKIIDYIQDSKTATVVQHKKKPSQPDQFITSELIYSWMVEYRIPPEYEKWHLSRLLTLIDVINENHKDPKENRMTQEEAVARQRRINEANKKKYAAKKKKKR